MPDSDIAIRVEHLSKRYRLGADAPYYRLSEALTRLPRRVSRKARRLAGRAATTLTAPEPPRKNPRPDMWALNDVSFEVKKGEVLGIIGKNGAGKSTLLKILSRITEPTHGRATLHGRVGSLLEVGTGFHPELTGRENIYLNGAILGMSRREVNQQFDAIVDFSELADFLDTPVKRYSSGMYTRLAFAVAAHLEPEILIVDEVLAVGDIQFQKKCLGKMDDVAKSGRTVLFVSHQMGAVESLCNRCIFLESGSLTCDGPPQDTIDFYLSNTSSANTGEISPETPREGSGKFRFCSIDFVSPTSNQPLASVRTGDDIAIRLFIENTGSTTLAGCEISVSFTDMRGRRVANLWSRNSGARLRFNPGRNTVYLHVPQTPLMPATYFISLFGADRSGICDWVKQQVAVDIESGRFFKNGTLPPAGTPIAVDHHYTVESTELA